MNASILRPLALGLLYLTIVSCSTNESVTPSQSNGARTAATSSTIECDVNQGYRFNQNQHATFGYITGLVIGTNTIAPDIRVIGTSAPPTSAINTSGIFEKPVVSVLTSANWSTLPNDNITFTGRISGANAQVLKTLALQGVKRVPISLSFVVYQFDLVNQVYYTRFKSYKGSVPIGSKANAGSDNSGDEPIYALLGKSNATEWGLKVGAKAEEDPAGIQNYSLELILAPTTAPAPQQILIQTSSKIKLIQPWGLPQP